MKPYVVLRFSFSYLVLCPPPHSPLHPPTSPLHTQLYYSVQDMGDPMQRKAGEQRRLLDHMRHPVFFGPALILWAVPVMSYDRLLIAVMAPLYLGWGSHLDQLDTGYVREQFTKKRCEIFDSHMD